MAISLGPNHVMVNGGHSAPSPSSSASHSGPPRAPPQHPPQSTWENERMLNVYILDYFTKRGFARAARELTEEADLVDPSVSKPPIDATQGLLYEWWSVFWEIFQAKSSRAGKPDATLYLEHSARMRALQQGPLAQPQGPMQVQPNMAQRPMIPGQPQPQPRPPGTPSGPPQLVANGAHPGQMPNGAVMQPNQPGGPVPFQVAGPQQGQMVNGIPPSLQAQVPSNVGPSGVPNAQQQPLRPQPGQQYASPLLAHQQPGAGPMRQQQQPPGPTTIIGGPRPGSGMMQHQHPGMQQQPPPYGMRPASRAGTPAGMRPSLQMSPPMAPQDPEAWRREWLAIKQQLAILTDGHFNKFRQASGLNDKSGLESATDDQAKAMLALWKTEMGQGVSINAPSPRNSDLGGPQRRGSKRGTSPDNEEFKPDASPPNKRQRPSPPMNASQPPGMTIMNMGPGQMNGMQARPPHQQMMPGMQQQQPGPGQPPMMQGGVMPGPGGPMNAMHMQPVGAMHGQHGGPPGQPMMVQGPQGQILMRPAPGQQPHPGGMVVPQGPPGPQGAAEFRQQPMTVMQHNKFAGAPPGTQMYNIGPPQPQQQDAGGPPQPGQPGQQPLNAAAMSMQRSAQQQGSKQPFGTGVMAPPGSPANKPQTMMPPPQTPKDDSADQHQGQANGMEAPSPSPGRPGYHNPGATNGVQPYPPVNGPEVRAGSTAPAQTQPSPAQPPPPAPPGPTGAATANAGLPASLFPDLHNDTLGGAWLGDQLGMDFPALEGFSDDFAQWINPEGSGDMINSV